MSALLPPLTPAQADRHASYDDALIRSILSSVRTVAIVGASDNAARPSFIVVKYLKERGYDVLPVNPRLGGRPLLGLETFARLSDIRRPVDMVEIFRSSAEAGSVTDEALGLDPVPKVIWMQLSVRDDAAAGRAEARGLTVVMNRCPKIEFGRLSGEIGWAGINSRLISSKRPSAGQGYQKLRLRP